MQLQVSQMQSMHHQNQSCCDGGDDVVAAVLGENARHEPHVVYGVYEPWRVVSVFVPDASSLESDD